MKVGKTLEEVRRIKEQCSLERLSRTPEEQRRHSEEVMKIAEAALGRPIITVNNSKSQKVELTQV